VQEKRRPRVACPFVVPRASAIAAMHGNGVQPGCCGRLTLAAVAERNNLKLDRLLETLRAAAAVRAGASSQLSTSQGSLRELQQSRRDCFSLEALVAAPDGSHDARVHTS
jgi:hypothetical protein